MPEARASSSHELNLSVSRPRKMPRNRMTSWRIVAKSGELHFSRSTFSACGAVSSPRGLIHNAAATTQEMVCGNTDTDGTGPPPAPRSEPDAMF